MQRPDGAATATTLTALCFGQLPKRCGYTPLHNSHRPTMMFGESLNCLRLLILWVWLAGPMLIQSFIEDSAILSLSYTCVYVGSQFF